MEKLFWKWRSLSKRNSENRSIRQNRLLISKLSTRIMNSILLHMQPETIRASTGTVAPSLAWRAAKLDDERVMVYGQDFVSIRDFSLFADTVGKLIIDLIKTRC